MKGDNQDQIKNREVKERELKRSGITKLSWNYKNQL